MLGRASKYMLRALAMQVVESLRVQIEDCGFGHSISLELKEVFTLRNNFRQTTAEWSTYSITVLHS